MVFVGSPYLRRFRSRKRRMRGLDTEEPGSGKVTEGEAHIRHFAVHPESVRRPIGASLLLRCFSDARSVGIRKLNCISTLNAVRFYQAFNCAQKPAMSLKASSSSAFASTTISRCRNGSDLFLCRVCRIRVLVLVERPRLPRER